MGTVTNLSERNLETALVAIRAEMLRSGRKVFCQPTKMLARADLLEMVGGGNLERGYAIATHMITKAAKKVTAGKRRQR